MADGILFDIAGRLLEVLGSQAFREIALAWGVKDDITKLNETVRSIKAVLLDAEKQHSKKNELVTQWLRRLKGVFYEADDLLDDFSTQLKKRQMMTGNKFAKEVCIFFSKSNQIAYSLKVADKIKTVREKLDVIAKDMTQFRFIEHHSEKPILNTKRETHSFELVENVIGREDDKNQIIQLLLDSNYDEDVSVTSIVGIGGLGKTTLARLVYNDEKVKRHFDLKIWTCVSDEFNVKEIVNNILKSMNAEKVGFENLNFEELQQRLREKINGKKYLLVLDDIWNKNREKWLQLKTLLVNDVKGSKILVTSRSKQVVKITSKPSLIYDLKSLTEGESWSLFTKLAFEDGIEPKGSKLVEIGKHIVARCVGVPLAIRTIGRLLYENNTESYWLHFMEDELMKIDEQEESDIIPTLKLSYDHLPSHLKQCFAYCSLFPKDYVINKESLINLWMAQGFLQSPNGSQSLEDVGNECFVNLVSRSFLQDVRCEKYLVTCKMHDLMHDLATSVAKPECILAKLDARNVDERTCDVSFDSKLESSWNIPNALLRANHIRTFILHGGSFYNNNDLNESNCRKVFSSFKCLRTLSLSASNIKNVPNSIGKLKHLRYLDLSDNKQLIKFSNSIKMLGNLQVLKVNRCRELEKLPKDIIKLVNLRCLEVDGCDNLVGMPRGLRQLTSLQSLSCFKLGEKDGEFADLNELNQLIINLRGRLKIEELQNATSNPTLSNLKAAQHIQSLEFYWTLLPFGDGEREYDDLVLESLEPHQNLKYLLIGGFQGVRIPNWLYTLTNLIEIDITVCDYCRHLPALDQLPSLKRLRLHALAVEYISDASSTMSISMSFFPSLEELRIVYCKNLKGWWRIDDGDIMQLKDLPSFPCLSYLYIDSCPNLTSMPFCPSLDDLMIYESSLKPFEKMMSNVPSSTSSISAGLLSRLKSLRILYPDTLDLPTEEYDKQWEALTSLRSIELCGLFKLVSLPKGFQRVTSLQSLKIQYCNNLAVLTEGMPLQYLEIEECPQLLECGSIMGVEWPKIAHIPDIKIDDRWIQKDGCYLLNSMEHASTSSVATEA